MISNPKILACISFFVGFLSLLAPWTTAFLIYQKLEKGENDFSSCLVPLLAFSTFFMISLVFTLYTIIYEICKQKLKIWFILGLAGIFKQICIQSCLFASLVHFYQKLKYGKIEDSKTTINFKFLGLDFYIDNINLPIYVGLSLYLLKL